MPNERAIGLICEAVHDAVGGLREIGERTFSLVHPDTNAAGDTVEDHHARLDAALRKLKAETSQSKAALRIKLACLFELEDWFGLDDSRVAELALHLACETYALLGGAKVAAVALPRRHEHG